MAPVGHPDKVLTDACHAALTAAARANRCQRSAPRWQGGRL